MISSPASDSEIDGNRSWKFSTATTGRLLLIRVSREQLLDTFDLPDDLAVPERQNVTVVGHFFQYDARIEFIACFSKEIPANYKKKYSW